MIGLRRRWPQAVFQVMREPSVEMEDLGKIKMTKRVSFAPRCQTSTVEVDPLISNQDETPTEDPTGMI